MTTDATTDPTLWLAIKALDGTTRGREGMEHLRAYIDAMFSWFSPDGALTDEEADFLCFLVALREAADPDGDSPFKLAVTKRKEGRGAPPASPSERSRRESQMVLAAIICDDLIARGCVPKDAEYKAKKRTGISRAEIHKARKLPSYIEWKSRNPPLAGIKE